LHADLRWHRAAAIHTLLKEFDNTTRTLRKARKAQPGFDVLQTGQEEGEKGDREKPRAGTGEQGFILLNAMALYIKRGLIDFSLSMKKLKTARLGRFSEER
jgi:hypothetical protein